MDLAADLAEKFDVESLEMFDSLKDVWSNANKSDFATASARKPNKVCVSVMTGVLAGLVLSWN